MVDSFPFLKVATLGLAALTYCSEKYCALLLLFIAAQLICPPAQLIKAESMKDTSSKTNIYDIGDSTLLISNDR